MLRLRGLIDEKADTTTVDRVIAALSQEITERQAAIRDLRAEMQGLISHNTRLIRRNAGDIADNLSYIVYIEDALSAPGASGISKYNRKTTP